MNQEYVEKMAAGPYLNFDEFMGSCQKTANSQQLLGAALGLTGEAGEFADHLKKVIFQGKDLDTDLLAKELGDIYWYWLLACIGIGKSPKQVLQVTRAKIESRYPQGFFSVQRSQNRT